MDTLIPKTVITGAHYAHDDFKPGEYGIDDGLLLELKYRAIGAKGVAYCELEVFFLFMLDLWLGEGFSVFFFFCGRFVYCLSLSLIARHVVYHGCGSGQEGLL